MVPAKINNLIELLVGAVNVFFNKAKFAHQHTNLRLLFLLTCLVSTRRRFTRMSSIGLYIFPVFDKINQLVVTFHVLQAEHKNHLSPQSRLGFVKPAKTPIQKRTYQIVVFMGYK